MKLLPVSTSTLVVTPLAQVHHREAAALARPAWAGSPGSRVAKRLLLTYDAPVVGTLIEFTKLSLAGSGMTSYSRMLVLVSLSGAEITSVMVTEVTLVGTLNKAE